MSKGKDTIGGADPGVGVAAAAVRVPKALCSLAFDCSRSEVQPETREAERFAKVQQSVPALNRYLRWQNCGS